MLSGIFSKLSVPQKRTLIERRFEPRIFTDTARHRELCQYGYTHIPGVLNETEVKALRDLYEEARTLSGFQHTDYYINTIGFDDPAIRDFLKARTEAILHPILHRFLDTTQASFPLGGGFCINPPRSTRGCNPHQDPTCVDERRSYSMTTWISLNDMTPENGCMHMLPGSHLWGNIHRSVCLPWAFEKQAGHLWKYLQPVPTRAGDVLCFDVSTIHSSTRNLTDQNRLAMTVQTIPKNYPLISYHPAGGNKADIYNIDQDYFIRESQYKRPSAKYPVTATIKLPSEYTQAEIDDLADAYSRLNKKNTAPK